MNKNFFFKWVYFYLQVIKIFSVLLYYINTLNDEKSCFKRLEYEMKIIFIRTKKLKRLFWKILIRLNKHVNLYFSQNLLDCIFVIVYFINFRIVLLTIQVCLQSCREVNLLFSYRDQPFCGAVYNFKSTKAWITFTSNKMMSWKKTMTNIWNATHYIFKIHF